MHTYICTYLHLKKCIGDEMNVMALLWEKIKSILRMFFYKLKSKYLNKIIIFLCCIKLTQTSANTNFGNFVHLILVMY